MKVLFFLYYLIIVGFVLNAQTYYGTNNLGKLEIINDSIYISYFTGYMNVDYIYQPPDTGYYFRNNDTIWLCSNITKNLKVIASNEEQKIGTGYPVLLKIYRKDYKMKNYKLVGENCFGIFDTLYNQIVYNHLYIHKDDILVIKDWFTYLRVKWEGNQTNFFTIKFLYNDDFLEGITYFDKFPLLIKGNTLIPIDEKKIEQCWVDNGFFFPKMKKSRREKTFNTIARWSKGLQGLPCSICVPGNPK